MSLGLRGKEGSEGTSGVGGRVEATAREGSSPRREDPPRWSREHVKRKAENPVPRLGVQGSREQTGR